MTTTAARRTNKNNGKATKPRTRKPNTAATSKPANVAAAAPKDDEWPIRRADRAHASQLLGELDDDYSALDVIWSLVGGPICKNIGTVMAFAEGLSEEQFRQMYEEVTGDGLVIGLDRDTRWDLMRELLPAIFVAEVESAFDSF